MSVVTAQYVGHPRGMPLPYTGKSGMGWERVGSHKGLHGQDFWEKPMLPLRLVGAGVAVEVGTSLLGARSGPLWMLSSPKTEYLPVPYICLILWESIESLYYGIEQEMLTCHSERSEESHVSRVDQGLAQDSSLRSE